MDKQNSLKPLTFLVSVSFLVLLGRLIQLQVVEGKINRFLGDSNRVQQIRIEAPRGLLLDRHGESLAENEPVYLEEKQEEEVTLSREEALKRQADGKDANLKIYLKRRYPEGSTFAHSLGYLGEVTDQELRGGKLELQGYFPGSLIGRAGLEAEYEGLLRGHEGKELIEVNTQGAVVRRLGRILPTPGKTLTLALDKKLQEVAAQAMASQKGAVIAQNPQNGEVLVFYSSPSYDPNLFEEKGKQEGVTRLVTDEENRPLFNRVISGLYPPGSTFKIVTAAAGLEEGKITASTLINDPGVVELNGFKYANWYFTSYGRTEGEINVEKALARSTDTFFYKLGEMVGIDRLNFWAKKFKVEEKSGIDLPSELEGFMATREWKEKTKGEGWFLGNTYHIAIGQGDLALTPLQVNLMTAVVATGGKWCTPRMLRIGAESTPYRADCREIGVQKKYLEVIKRGMIGACAEGGTGTPFFDFKPKVACKTGTAETGDDKTSHAWFTVMAPADNPQIVLTVLVERGGEGSSVAAPIAKEILREYFKGE